LDKNHLIWNLKQKMMHSKNKKCLFRNCEKTLDENLNGNIKYCPEKDGFDSCYQKEKRLREKERIKKNKEKLARESRLLELIGNIGFFQTGNYLQYELFYELFSPYFDLFKEQTIKGSTCYFYQNTAFFKVLKDNNELIAVDSRERIISIN
jgi:hypothetical protein